MQILHVVPALAARYGGPSVATLGMCRALHASGVDTLVATTDADGGGRLNVPVERVDLYDGVRTIFFRRRFTESYKWSGGLSAWVRAHAGDFDAAHIHAVFSHSSIAAGRACRDAGVPYIVRPLGTLDPWSINRKPLRKRALLRLGADRLLRGAAAMHYTSVDEQRLAESVIERLTPGVVVPNGIDDDIFGAPHDASGDHPYLICLARLHEKKGIDVVIRAFHQLAGDCRFAEWRLLLGGDGAPSYVAQLRALAASGAAASRIDFLGWIDAAAKVELLRHASAFVLPSQQENFGISVAEALAAAVPVIITPEVNLAADVESARAGWVVDRSVPALTALMRDVLPASDELERRGRCGRALAERFRWTTVARGLTSMYQQVIVRCAA